MPFTIRSKIEGLEQAFEQMRSLPEKLAKRTLKKAVTKATQKLTRAVKHATPRRFGILRKSIGSKVKQYAGGSVVGVVGARQGFRQEVGKAKQDSRPGARYPRKAGDPIYANPVKYLHLVELGTSRYPGLRFIQRTQQQLQATLREEMVAVIQAGLKQALENK